MDTALIIPAFIAGLFTFLAPCTLPLVPAYLSFISGVSNEELKNPETAKAAKRKVFLNGLFFILGFSLVFVIFGTLAGLLGQSLVPIRLWLGRIGGVMVILFGLLMLGVIKFRLLSAEHHMKMPSFLKRGKLTSSFTVGSAFAVGWTPCVGPILGSILLFASTSGTAFQGAFLLAVFSLGLAIPFILISFGVSRASEYINSFFATLNRWRVVILALGGVVVGFLVNLALLGIGIALGQGTGEGIVNFSQGLLENAVWLFPLVTAIALGLYAWKRESMDVLSSVGGFFLIPLGVLLLTDSFGIVIQYGYEVFSFLNYEGLLDYL